MYIAVLLHTRADKNTKTKKEITYFTKKKKKEEIVIVVRHKRLFGFRIQLKKREKAKRTSTGRNSVNNRYKMERERERHSVERFF